MKGFLLKKITKPTLEQVPLKLHITFNALILKSRIVPSILNLSRKPQYSIIYLITSLKLHILNTFKNR